MSIVVCVLLLSLYCRDFNNFCLVWKFKAGIDRTSAFQVPHVSESCRRMQLNEVASAARPAAWLWNEDFA